MLCRMVEAACCLMPGAYVPSGAAPLMHGVVGIHNCSVNDIHKVWLLSKPKLDRRHLDTQPQVQMLAATQKLRKNGIAIIIIQNWMGNHVAQDAPGSHAPGPVRRCRHHQH